MAGQHSFKWDRASQRHPQMSAAPPQAQGAYADVYPSYDYSVTSTPNLMAGEYPQSSRFITYQPSSHYSSQTTSRGSRSSSEAEEGMSSQAQAPVHSTYVMPGQPNAVGTVSPTSLHEHPPQHRLSPQQHHYSPPMGYSQGYPGAEPHTSPRVGRPTLPSVFSRGPAQNGGDDPYTPSHTPRPGGVVGSSDGWAEGAPYELPLPPKLALSSGSNKKKASATAPRKRVPASCTPCRKKKLRCNRSMPCTSCVERGEPDGCIWEGDAVPLFVAREENDVKELKAQVDRLQHLLDALSQSPDPRPYATRQGSGASKPPQASLDKTESPGLDAARFDLHAQDLCAGLSELALNGVMPSQQAGGDSFAPGGHSGEAFLDEAKRFLLAFTQHAGLSTEPGFHILTPSSAAPTPPSPAYPPGDATMKPASSSGPSALALTTAMLDSCPTIGHVLDLLPCDAELQSAYKFYASYVHWYSSPINLAAFEQRWAAFRTAVAQPGAAQRERDADPLFIATLLGACASGLAGMTNEQAQDRGFPENRSPLVERWVRTAMLSLVIGKFMEEPSLDGVRASVIIASLYVFMTTGETISAGMSLLALAVHAVLALGLHRDPSRASDPPYSFAESEERRRLFWCVFSLCMSITAGTSRTWSQFDLRQIDCKFPLDCYDAELAMDERAAKARVRSRRAAESFEETPMTASLLRAQYGLLVKKVTDKAFGVMPCSYQDVLALDAELSAFEKSFPPTYTLPIDRASHIHFSFPPTLTEMRAALIQLCLSAEFVRLHRPFLVLGAADDRYQRSREQCVKYAKRLLAINATPGCKLNWAGHNFKVISAAVTLGVELLQSPLEPDAPVIRNMVNLALKQAEGFAGVSSVCRKGSGVVRFLLSKIDEEAVSASAPRQAKRPRTLRYSPDEDELLRKNIAQALGGAPSAPSSRTASPDYNTRRRKATRPPLLHVLSDTIVPQVTATLSQRLVQAPLLRATRSRSADQAFPTLNTLAHSGPHSAEASYGSYVVAPPARQIAGLGSASSRRWRNSSNMTADSSTSASAIANAMLSSPETGLHLLMPDSAYLGADGALSSASTTGEFDFSGLALTSGQPTNASMLDDCDEPVFFHATSSLGRGVGEQSAEDGAPGGQSGESKFNVPLTDEDFSYLQHYQN